MEANNIGLKGNAADFLPLDHYEEIVDDRAVKEGQGSTSFLPSPVVDALMSVFDEARQHGHTSQQRRLLRQDGTLVELVEMHGSNAQKAALKLRRQQLLEAQRHEAEHGAGSLLRLELPQVRASLEDAEEFRKRQYPAVEPTLEYLMLQRWKQVTA